ncbi:23S rRNA (guanosine(2251)-2'-O)-methyltransferase RlmB [Selenomonadales bacterium OttesenSCG-928-I06]|nr:23S rRNA (guanosine(2251)-2'-O)-methyltransferase RlmB [Selenomonadales bacterium OttesenSCG-928-I06]
MSDPKNQSIDNDTEIIAGKNSVLEALRAGRSINKILISESVQKNTIKEILNTAKESGVIVQWVDSRKLDKIAVDTKHQGIIGQCAPIQYFEIEEIVEQSKNSSQIPFLVLLDELNDPHNVGAILRTAEAAGVHGVLIPKRRSCPINYTVAKASAGASEYIPIARIGNVASCIKYLKEEGFWVVGADMAGNINYYEADFKMPLVLVIGSEGKGLSRLTKESCDFLVKIPMLGKISSLNASVAGSLLLYEALRQRL